MSEDVYTKDDALGLLDVASEALENAIEKFDELADLLDNCTFQENSTEARIRAYTIPALRSFVDAESQSGSVVNILQEINHEPDEEYGWFTCEGCGKETIELDDCGHGCCQECVTLGKCRVCEDELPTE